MEVRRCLLRLPSKYHLLRELYSELTIPEAVWCEVVVEGAGQPGSDEVKAAPWIKIQAAANRTQRCGN